MINQKFKTYITNDGNTITIVDLPQWNGWEKQEEPITEQFKTFIQQYEKEITDLI